MWMPALGGLAVGIIGYFAPRTMGVGYDNIEQVLAGRLTGTALLVLVVLKFVSWSIALGSGTSGGTLAPLFTIGGGVGALAGGAVASALPQLGIDPRIAALVGMAAIFAGASRALLASVVFAFETTLQPLGLLPLLGACTAAYLVSCFLMRHTIMTEKIARRGVRVPSDYAADFLDQLSVGQVATREVTVIRGHDRVGEVRAWLLSGAPGSAHQAFPVVDADRRLQGLLPRSAFEDRRTHDDVEVAALLDQPATVTFEDRSLRDAADQMAEHGVERLVVVAADDSRHLRGILTRTDLVLAHRARLGHERVAVRTARRKADATPVP
jgi:CBS domain-containing protein